MPARSPRRFRRALSLTAVAAVAAAGLFTLPQLGAEPARTAGVAEAARPVVFRMVFPVRGRVRYSASSFGACRAGCKRRHQGVDIMGTKMQKLVAAVPGRITNFH